jgi:hypothetical protein
MSSKFFACACVAVFPWAVQPRAEKNTLLEKWGSGIVWRRCKEAQAGKLQNVCSGRSTVDTTIPAKPGHQKADNKPPNKSITIRKKKKKPVINTCG